MRPASVCETDAISSRFCEPVRTNRPGRGFSSTATCMYDNRSGARCISSMTKSFSEARKLRGSSMARDLTSGASIRERYSWSGNRHLAEGCLARLPRPHERHDGILGRHKGYNGLGRRYQRRKVVHSVGQYVDGMAHTNGIESFWAPLKRAYKRNVPPKCEVVAIACGTRRDIYGSPYVRLAIDGDGSLIATRESKQGHLPTRSAGPTRQGPRRFPWRALRSRCRWLESDVPCCEG